MEKSQLIKQIEFYSNSIVAFIVLQGLAYCYYFGTNELFNSFVKTGKGLSVGLVFMFSLTMLLSLIANIFIGKQIVALIGKEYMRLIRIIYFGKLFVILLFGILPIIVTLRYAVLTRAC